MSTEYHCHVYNVAFPLYLNDRNLATLQRRYEQLKISLADPELSWETFLEIELSVALSLKLDDIEAAEMRLARAVDTCSSLA